MKKTILAAVLMVACLVGPLCLEPGASPTRDGEKCTITIQVSPEGGGTTNHGVGKVAGTVGRCLRLQALPSPSYSFLRWEVTKGKADVARPSFVKTVMVCEEDATITAVFQKIKHRL